MSLVLLTEKYLIVEKVLHKKVNGFGKDNSFHLCCCMHLDGAYIDDKMPWNETLAKTYLRRNICSVELDKLRNPYTFVYITGN